MSSGRTADFERCYFDMRLREGCKERGDVRGFEHGLVPLDVNVDFRGDLLRDGEEAVGAAG